MCTDAGETSGTAGNAKAKTLDHHRDWGYAGTAGNLTEVSQRGSTICFHVRRHLKCHNVLIWLMTEDSLVGVFQWKMLPLSSGYVHGPYTRTHNMNFHFLQ